jgi:hypothetical protein
VIVSNAAFLIFIFLPRVVQSGPNNLALAKPAQGQVRTPSRCTFHGFLPPVTT